MVTPNAQDTFFYDPQKALEVAKQQNRVELTRWASGLQLCYYTGSNALLGPDNFIHVPLDGIVDFFCETRLRLPTSVTLPGAIPGEDPQERIARMRFSTLVQRSINEAGRRMERSLADNTKAMRALTSTTTDGESLRVYASASNTTTVMQYCSRGMLDAFARLGHRTRFEIEANDMERCSWMRMQASALEFRPHLAFNINHRNHDLVPPDGVNVIWWQDQMPELTAAKPLEWRDNDLVYVVMTNRFAPLLKACGLPPERIRVQPFCIDREIFHPRGPEERRDKVVFVGSSYSSALLGKPIEKGLIAELEERFTAGEPLNEAVVTEASIRHRINPDYGMRTLLHYVSRDLSVRWLCQQQEVPVEIYGRDWGNDPIVAPFFKGELPQGPRIAEVYRSARWALVVHPELINHQRMGEVGACGCIPIVLDVRHHADGPFWDDQALYFRTAKDLRACLERRPIIDAAAFGEHFDYLRFAKRILADVETLPSRRAPPVLAGHP